MGEIVRFRPAGGRTPAYASRAGCAGQRPPDWRWLRCNGCGEAFDRVVPAGARPLIFCPRCGSGDWRDVLAGFGEG